MPYITFNNNTEPSINDTNLNLLQELIKQDISGSVGGDTLPIGSIIPYTNDVAPSNWLICDGSAISRETYKELFTIIGTTFGIGDGFLTFNLPDLRGKVAVGKDADYSDFNTIGNIGGEIQHKLTVDEMPTHKHKSTLRSTDGQRNADNGSNWNLQGVNVNTTTGNNYDTSNTGGDNPHNNMQPYIITNYIIKAEQSAGVVATVVNNLDSESEIDALSAKQGKILSNRNNYSTEEQIIGKWIDGNNLYRKVLVISKNSITSNNLNIDISNLDIDELCNYSAKIKRTDGVYFKLNRGYGSAEWQAYFGDVTKNSIRITLGSSTYNYTDIITIILEYTKK